MPSSEEKVDHHRKWLHNLLQKHHNTRNSVEQQIHDELIAKFPILQNKALVVAPMVEQSDLPFRLLCRRYGANLCYTPMINARYFVKKQTYRDKMFNFTTNVLQEEDRPLVAQLCGNNKEVLLDAARLLEHHVDAIDINLGCPTKVAKRGGFGAYLLESQDYIVNIVRYLVDNLSIPVTVKVRILPQGIEQSLELYRKLIDAGISLMVVHGRTRMQMGIDTGVADWDAIHKVVQRFGQLVPIIANGGIGCLDDVRACLAHTGADGVMSSESILEYPPLYSESGTTAVQYKRTGPGRLQIAREYLDLCKEFPPEKGGGGTRFHCIKSHMQVFCYEDWKGVDPTLRYSLFPIRYNDFERLVESHVSESDLDYFYYLFDKAADIQRAKHHAVEDERLNWYIRHRNDTEI